MNVIVICVFGNRNAWRDFTHEAERKNKTFPWSTWKSSISNMRVGFNIKQCGKTEVDAVKIYTC